MTARLLHVLELSTGPIRVATISNETKLDPPKTFRDEQSSPKTSEQINSF